MAKTIKTIQCPQCGSTQNTIIDEDKYHCNHCNADFFLDNDDVNIFINNKKEGLPVDQSLNGCVKPILYFMGISVILSIGIFMFSTFFTKKGENTVTTIKSVQLQYTTSVASSYVVTFKDKPIYVEFNKRSYKSRDSKDVYVMTVYDALKKGLLKETQIPNITGARINIKTLSDGNTYVIAGTKNIYKVNDNYSLSEITEEMKGKYPELKSGIGSVIFPLDFDAFVVLSNDGKNYYILPQYEKIYSKEEIQKKQTIESSNKQEKYNFTFTKDNFLVKIKYKTEEPDLLIFPKNIENINSPNILSMGKVSNKKYTTPNILYADDTYVVINYKDDKTNEGYVVECIDAKDNKGLWSFTSDLVLNTACRYKDGFAMSNKNKKVIVINTDGTNKQIIEFK